MIDAYKFSSTRYAQGENRKNEIEGEKHRNNLSEEKKSGTKKEIK